MPHRTDINKILILGSGPIIIGQACEFDYSGSQACRALKQLGYKVVLVNSNPATIMTDPELADRTYVEPLHPEIVEKIIARERPDALLPTMGGQTSLNLAVALAESGALAKYGVELIGAKLEAIKKAENRALFKEAMLRIGLEVPKSGTARHLDEAMAVLDLVGFPAIIRPAFTLGGSGGSIAYNIEEYKEQVEWGLRQSPISEVLIEQSVIGWKEYELEVMRDLADNVVIICSIENFDPMGIHTGDSITVAPAQTLTDREYQRMRDAAVKIIREIGVETGGSNIQFAINPTDGRMVTIEMNPRVSRSSALASKATGFPIAKIAAKLAVGLTLDEIPNDITGETPASFEPTLDYVVVKIPRWDFEKFRKADSRLGTQMKSVGEVMAIGRTFKEALGKGLRSLEIGRYGLGADGKDELNGAANIDELIRQRLCETRPDRIFFVRHALRHGIAIDEIYRLTGIDPWFLRQIAEMVDLEESLRSGAASYAGSDGNGSINETTDIRDLLYQAKASGFSDVQLAHITGQSVTEIMALRRQHRVQPVFKTVDTCAAEFRAVTPYYYSTYEEQNEAVRSERKKIVILGGGPNRIGQGIEFDYCAVHGVMALRELGYETIMINCNPETVSTDYDIADKLYFEPLTFEDVVHVLELEQPDGIIVQFGGQTPLKLAIPLERAGFRIIGTSPDSIDLAEDRGRFGELLAHLGIRQPENGIAFSFEEARRVAKSVGYPVLLRPSYVLGGRAMEIVYDESQLESYITRATAVSPEHPILIDEFLEDAFEFDVDALADGENVWIGGIMQHIEEAGIHSGDSSCMLPPYLLREEHRRIMIEWTEQLGKVLKVCGLMNIQFAMKNNEVYVLEVNPRASRTVPFVGKATGVPMAKIAAKLMVGHKLSDFDLPENSAGNHIACKTPVFPFIKFPGVSNYLGPEMKSTGEVMGIGETFGVAFAKAQIAAGHALPTSGGAFISVNDFDKARVIPIARRLREIGFKLLATRGTAQALREAGLPVQAVFKVNEGRPDVIDHLLNGEIQIIINTPLGKTSRYDEYAIGRNAIAHNIPCLTTLSASAAAVEGIRALQEHRLGVKSLQEYHANLVSSPLEADKPQPNQPPKRKLRKEK
ncbi:MAG: carbamoyl-phosphate synthase large subunit [candidate division KSB1 bacterium]|nr:carbamoyl-phosphate synthase large subunit [candidate division KSB1 bacterium]MDZ7301628.1 carbamoyl-phosphate synthase large subunit [candidate division KSB1 bacterium]MDZ7310956.1 carbamoyl-phosphate synthase large subunit [candidate division KSB1 bacterium]